MKKLLIGLGILSFSLTGFAESRVQPGFLENIFQKLDGGNYCRYWGRFVKVDDEKFLVVEVRNDRLDKTFSFKAVRTDIKSQLDEEARPVRLAGIEESEGKSLTLYINYDIRYMVYFEIHSESERVALCR